MNKRPSLQFYPKDWFGDSALQSCSLFARGLWLEMICIAHDSATYGYLVRAGGSPLSADEIARMVRESLPAVNAALTELETAGVFSRDRKSGAIFSRRMVADEKRRKQFAKYGKQGGNPNLSRVGLTHGISQPAIEDEEEETSGEKKRSGKRECAMPPEFHPTAGNEALAARLGLNLADEFTAFSEHHASKGNTFVRWDLALNTWLRNSRKFGGLNGSTRTELARQQTDAGSQRAEELFDRITGRNTPSC